jgi:hypothetical protein
VEVAGMAGTGLSPEWDRGYDAAFADLISSDADLVRSEFNALIRAMERKEVPDRRVQPPESQEP